MKRDLHFLLTKKNNHLPITMITAYDWPTAKIADTAGIDCILIGDSVGTNVLGYASEREVTMADMLHHTAAVRRGVQDALLIADLPFHTAESALEAEKNARRLLEKGADIVKMEGWAEKKEMVAHLAGEKIPVCAHIGYNPQIHGSKPHVYGSKVDEARMLLDSALLLEQSGAQLLIMEKVAEEVAGIITEQLRIPTIGIGSGRHCNGQVLVIHDLLGFSEKTYKHARKFLDLKGLASAAIKLYITEVEGGRFPSEENVHHADQGELDKFLRN